jgi:uncharacterized protein YajQ (UPF0234 family)
MASFDVVSELDLQEVDNAVNQAKKEIESRYDFRGSKSEFKWDKKEIVIMADDDYKVNAMKDILQTKLHRRGIDIRAMKFDKVEPAGGMLLRQKVSLVQGIDKKAASDICKAIKDSKLKVQAQITDDKVRVTSKSIDELQAAINHLKGQTFPVALQFNNFR